MRHFESASQRPETFRSVVGEVRIAHTFRVVWNPVGDGPERPPDNWANQIVFTDHDESLHFIDALLRHGVATFAVAHNISPQIGPFRDAEAEATEGA